MGPIWQMQGYSISEGKGTAERHVQINDAGSAGWEVQITYNVGGTPEVERLIYMKYHDAKVAAQALAIQ
jgi:hypothetical protein